MPILDPSQQYFLLLNQSKQTSYEDGYAFFFKYLQIASKNRCRKHTTIEPSIQFKSDLQDSISFVNEEFGCNFTIENDFLNVNIKDYYKYFYKHINYPKKSEASKMSIGSYLICNDKFSTKFYSPYILLYQYHSWYLSDTPIAILCLDSTKFLDLDENTKKSIFQLIKLEIDLMEAAGLTLVLCYNGLQCTNSFLYQIIKDNQFSELHINIFDENFLYEFLNTMKNNYFIKPEIYKGFLYIYSTFFEKNSAGWYNMVIFKNMPRTKVITFSVMPDKALKKLEFIKTDPFPFCRTGFDHDYLRICLCYVPLFDIDSTKVTTFDFTGHCIGYISIDDFLYDNHKRTPIYIDDANFEQKTQKAINFNDIHFVRPDLFVENTLFLMPIENEKHEYIKAIKADVDKEFKDKKYDKFQDHWNPNKIQNKDDKIPLKEITKIICAYTYIMREKFKSDFSIRYTQIYAVIESYLSFKNINKKKDKDKSESSNKNKGVVYQIKTGEGKSCIVSLIAAILAKSGKVVHVVSSNIKLSNRDYLDSYEFFNSLNIKSTVLLHKNELPYYTNNSSIKVESEYLQAKEEGKYPDKFFSDDTFNNTSRMNFIACGLDNENKCGKIKDGKRVIFSTLVNFECFYLHLMENCPAYIDEFYENCVLLIDEADSILIDEIANGTIISREMRSNAKEVLTKVYDSYNDNKSVDEVYNDLIQNPLCKEISKKDIEEMYREIGIVERPEFSHGKKYSVQTFTVKNRKRLLNLVKKTVNFIQYVYNDFVDDVRDKIIENNVKSLFFHDDNDDDDDNEEEEDDDEDLDTSKSKEFKKIVPFDYDHKGILEPNKEFSGFIPQFIALKESKKHPDLIFKDISISYMYISHPIYAKLYKYICGFTGTTGKLDDRKIFRNEYQLEPQNIHRHKPNLRIDFPITVCESIQERNKKISEEVLYFHKKGNPVLVIFQDFNEIIDAVRAIQNEFVSSHENEFHDKLKNVTQTELRNTIKYQRKISNKIKKFVSFTSPNNQNIKIYDSKLIEDMKHASNTHKKIKVQFLQINIFDGTDEFVKPDLIAGVKGSISLGSNICGRGTDIKCSSEYPLHVIVSFYTSNDRVMKQAFGRTARKGEGGSCHVICLKNQVIENKLLNSESVKKVVSNANYMAHKQKEFIDKYKNELSWLFDQIEKKTFTTDIKNRISKKSDVIEKLRKTRINVNRIIAYKYRFPICLSYKTFIKIQAQKILSLFNCPNSVYVWRLFQRYMRELILESWSLMTKKVDNEYNKSKMDYKLLLDIEFKKLTEQLEQYLPKENRSNILNVFIHICEKVIDEFKPKILNEKKKGMFRLDLIGSTFLSFGFKPYSLLSESGARILYSNLDKMNYIQDPELKYEKQLPNNKFTILSITERIDDVLNKVFQKANEILGQKTFLKFFVRRTIAGCEFGICFDLLMMNNKSDIKDDPFILVDKNPIFVLTIFAWSLAPLLVGMLMFLLFYLSKISGKIASYIVCPAKIVTDVVSFAKEKAIEFVKSTAEKLSFDFLETCSEHINKYLETVLAKQIEKIEEYDKDSIFISLSKLLDFTAGETDYVDKLSESINKIVGDVKISPLLSGIIKEVNISPTIIKTGFLLILCIATFIKNFKHSLSITNCENDAAEFDSMYNSNRSESKIDEKLESLEKKNDSDIIVKEKDPTKVQKIDENQMNSIMKSIISSEYFKFLEKNGFKSSPFEISLSDILTSKNQSNRVIYLPTKKHFYKIIHKPDEEFFNLLEPSNIHQQQRQQGMMMPPVFLKPLSQQFFGFVINGDNSFFLYDVKDIRKKSSFNEMSLCILAYGLACGMEFLHKNNVIYDLNLSNIFLSDDSRPLIFDKQPDMAETKGNDFMPPEAANGPIDQIDQKKKANVYSYGKILFYLVNKNKEEYKKSIFSIDDIDNNSKEAQKQSANNNNNNISGSEWGSSYRSSRVRKQYTPYNVTYNINKSLIYNCVETDPNKRPTFSQICDVIERKYVVSSEANAYIKELKQFRRNATANITSRYKHWQKKQ